MYLWYTGKNQLTGAVHPQTYCAQNCHGNEIHKVQPDPFGEHKALRQTVLTRCSSVGIIGRSLEGRGRRRDIGTSEHRSLFLEMEVEYGKEGGGTDTPSTSTTTSTPTVPTPTMVTSLDLCPVDRDITRLGHTSSRG